MRKNWHKALLMGVLLALGVSVPAVAAKKTTKAAATAGKKTALAKSQKQIKPAAAKPSKKTQAAKSAKSSRQIMAGKTHRPTVARHLRRAEMQRVSFEPQLENGKLALYSASAYVIDQASGETLVDKNSSAVLPIASISKLMTAMVVLDAQQNMQEVISIGEEDVDNLKGTRSRLPVGTTMTRQTAMLLALMSSDNRAAHALARHYPGGLPAFVAAMNLKARVLGLKNTRFEEPTGLSSGNVSTARDLAIMVAHAAEYPEIRAASTTAEATLDVNGRIQQFSNTNALVKSDTWQIEVSKTGFISEAGRCLVMKARVASRPVVIVLLDSNGKMTRVGDAIRIKRWMESASIGHKLQPRA